MYTKGFESLRDVCVVAAMNDFALLSRRFLRVELYKKQDTSTDKTKYQKIMNLGPLRGRHKPLICLTILIIILVTIAGIATARRKGHKLKKKNFSPLSYSSPKARTLTCSKQPASLSSSLMERARSRH